MAIIFDHVSHTYLEKTPFQFQALRDISLTIHPQSFTAIIGHTGSGKSTLIQHINALLVPSSGTLTVNDIKIVANKTPKQVKLLRAYAGLVFQFPEYQLFEETVEQDVMFGPLNFGKTKLEARAIAHAMLTKVGIDASFYQRSPFELSGGERRRVAIAGILALQPKVLILDEPTAGLDPQGARMLMDIFKDLQQQGLTIILVTHDMNMVYAYADEVIVMDQGKVSLHTSTLALFHQPNLPIALAVPQLVALVHTLQAQGMNLDLSKIRTIDELVREVNGLKVS